MTDHLPTSPVHAADEAGAEWRRLHPAYILTGLVRNLRGLLFPLVFIFFSRGFEGDLIFYASSAVIALGAGLFSFVGWLFFRYALTPGELRVRSGVVARQERSVPYERVQSVDVDAAPLERIFGVVRMRVETAAGGSSQSDVRLQALSRADADILRAEITARRQRSRAVPAADSDGPGHLADAEAAEQTSAVSSLEEGELIRRLSWGGLLVAGMTSGRIGPAAALIGAAFQFVDELIPQAWWERLPAYADGFSLTWVVVLAILIGVVAWILAIGSTVLTFAGFELRRAGDQLVLAYGLLDRRRSTIPLRRIQAVRVEEGWLRQPFGRAELRFDSAGYGGSSGDAGVLFPYLPLRDIQPLLDATCPDFAMEVAHAPAGRLPERARARYIFAAIIGWLILIALLAPLFWWVSWAPVWWAIAGLALTPLFALLGWLRYHDAGWALAGDGRLLLRWRSIGRTTFITRRARIQHRALSANPLQRRAALATFHVAVPSGGGGGHVALPHLDESAAAALLLHLGPRAR
ncbi:MAG: PH domain-containing protein [Chloroflexia bacterium]|nr:PH domain-containing protein [Chloroflexia bacterium]